MSNNALRNMFSIAHAAFYKNFSMERKLEMAEFE